MIQTQEELIENALLYFKRGDFSLGYRTLLDASLNTDSTEIFIKVLDFVEKYENESSDDKSSLLLLFTECCNQLKKIKIEFKNLVGTTILKADNITKDYNKGRFVLGPVNIELKKGDIFGLVGENGNGKTTLLTVLASLNKVSAGSLEYSFSSKNKDAYDVLSKLVYIPQRTAVWYGKVLDNLKFTLVHYGVKGKKNDLLVLMMVARFGLWKYKDLKWSELSSGYKMRFELARTMLRKPEIILLDEPLANLDILAQQIILEDLKMMSKSPVNPIAMVFSSQQLYEVEKISDEVIYLRNGKPSNELNIAEKTAKQLIIELDATNSREELETVFKELNLEKLEFNGGVYILYFKDEITFNNVLNTIASHQLNVTYIRDISKSTRRFFVY
ncbi:ATP-binding cassette domain-containing protein [Polaribacter sp. HaHaR_3_91]|uniref:ABC transporter ATP-binding protein n=1 Tax=Polaribacter sp. HaHaR_3_91 TaxID=2745561 RepID=UPI001C4F1407|nr:ABC transporter ATP-binding protein [Polaribacter sp. HaHaR_3_91]QXP63745.1 ABC transporter ATP-binding protein [Polaribacter sp. HaHaR_3_91]